MVRTDGQIQLAWIGLRAPCLANREKGAIWAFLPLLLRKDNGAVKMFPVLRSCKKEGFAFAEGRIEKPHLKGMREREASREHGIDRTKHPCAVACHLVCACVG